MIIISISIIIIMTNIIIPIFLTIVTIILDAHEKEVPTPTNTSDPHGPSRFFADRQDTCRWPAQSPHSTAGTVRCPGAL